MHVASTYDTIQNAVKEQIRRRNVGIVMSLYNTPPAECYTSMRTVPSSASAVRERRRSLDRGEVERDDERRAERYYERYTYSTSLG